VGEIKVRVKIHTYTWNWDFLVSKALSGPANLGAVFIAGNEMVLELAMKSCYFAFAPAVGIHFLPGESYATCLSTNAASSKLRDIRDGNLTEDQRQNLEQVISPYSDILNTKLGLTNLMEYDIQLLDHTPVRSAPYRLAPPKMQALRTQVRNLLCEGVVEPSR
jgi:hypothetical protein